MATKTAPTTASAETHQNVTNPITGAHRGHRLTKVGAVSVDQGNGGGNFTVYYCQNEHVLFMDITT